MLKFLKVICVHLDEAFKPFWVLWWQFFYQWMVSSISSASANPSWCPYLGCLLSRLILRIALAIIIISLICTLVKRSTTEIVHSLTVYGNLVLTAPCSQYHQLLIVLFQTTDAPNLQKQNPGVSFFIIYHTSGIASSSSSFLHEKLIKQDRVAEDYVFTPFITLCNIVLLFIESTTICRILSFLSYI